MLEQIRTVVFTPVGTFYSAWSKPMEIEEEEFDAGVGELKQKLAYLTFEGQDGQRFVVQSEALARSVIVFERRETPQEIVDSLARK